MEEQPDGAVIWTMAWRGSLEEEIVHGGDGGAHESDNLGACDAVAQWLNGDSALQRIVGTERRLSREVLSHWEWIREH
jgi:hypothetical protein